MLIWLKKNGNHNPHFSSLKLSHKIDINLDMIKYISNELKKRKENNLQKSGTLVLVLLK